MCTGILLTVLAALISILSTSKCVQTLLCADPSNNKILSLYWVGFVTSRDCYQNNYCVIEDSCSCYIHKSSKENESDVFEEKQIFDAVPVQTHHKLAGKTNYYWNKFKHY